MPWMISRAAVCTVGSPAKIFCNINKVQINLHIPSLKCFDTAINREASLIVMDVLLKETSNVQSKNSRTSFIGSFLNIPRVTFPVISCLWQFKTVTLEMTPFRNVQYGLTQGSHGSFLSLFCYVSRDTSCSRDFNFVFVFEGPINFACFWAEQRVLTPFLPLCFNRCKISWGGLGS